MIKKVLSIKDYQDRSTPETWGSLLSYYSTDMTLTVDNVSEEELAKLNLIYQDIKGFEKGGYRAVGFNIDYIHPRLDANMKVSITNLNLAGQTVNGTVSNVVYSDYEVKTYVKTDIYYENATYQIDQNGNWGGSILYGVQPNLSARLVRKVGGIEIDRCGESNIDYTKYFLGTFTNPTGVTSDYVIEVSIVADIAYLIETLDLSTDGYWGGYYPQSGSNLFVAKRVADGEPVCETYQSVGLLRSYNIPQTDEVYSILNQRCYIYDQAVSVIVACIMGKESDAERWTRGILNTAYTDGQYAFSYQSISGNKIDPYFRSGAQFWVFTALMFFLEKYPLNLIAEEVEIAVVKGLNTMINEYWVTGNTLSQYTFTMGKGLYSQDYQTFDANWKSEISSTENNIDAYFVYKMAAKYFNSETYADILEKLTNSLLVTLWNPETKRAYQGVTNNVLDSSHALDCGSWYAIMAASAGDMERADEAMKSTEPYKVTISGVTGFKPYSKEMGYSSAVDTIWGEGVGGVVLGYQSIGNVAKSNYYWNQIYDNLRYDDGFPYVTTPVLEYEMKDWISLISTAWMIISKVPSGFWDVNQNRQLIIGTIPILLTQTIDDIGYYNPLIETWRPNTIYKYGSLVEYQDNSYSCILTHTGDTGFNTSNWIQTPTGVSQYSISITGGTKIEQFRRYGKTESEADFYNPIWNTGFTQTIQSSNGLTKQIVSEKDNLNELSFQKLYDYKIWMDDNTGSTINYSDINSDESIITYNSLGLSKNNAIEASGVKLDYLMGVVEPPKINIDVFIDRGSNSSFESHIRLSEIKSLKDLETYGNGYYKIKEN